MRRRSALLGLLIVVTLVALSDRARRDELLESIKDASDDLIHLGLRVTSRFGAELTDERRAEQPAFRARRVRDLR